MLAHPFSQCVIGWVLFPVVILEDMAKGVFPQPTPHPLQPLQAWAPDPQVVNVPALLAPEADSASNTPFDEFDPTVVRPPACGGVNADIPVPQLAGTQSAH